MIERAVRRLKSWNVNTIANWSNQEVINTRKVPYTAVIHTQYGHFIQDPFSPDFQKGLEKRWRIRLPATTNGVSAIL